MSRWVLVLVLCGALAGTGACGGHHHTTSPTPVEQPPPDPPPPPPPPPPPTLKVSRILAFGDSMTEGTTSPAPAFTLDAGKPESYPFKLQTIDAALYTAQTVSVFNAGRAGERASDARSRLNSAINQAAPDVVLLMEGANDLNLLGPDGVSKTTNAMEDMVRDTLGRSLPIFVATLPPQRPNSRSGGAAAFVTKYNDSLRQMAAKKGAQLVDVYSQFPLELIGQDGLHPTEAGYQKMAEIFQAALAAAYEVPSSSRAINTGLLASPATTSSSATALRRASGVH